MVRNSSGKYFSSLRALAFHGVALATLVPALCWAGSNETAPGPTPVPTAAGDAVAVPEAVPHFPIWLQDPWSGDNKLTMVREPSTELWNAARIDDYESAIAVDAAPPLGVLTINRLNIQAPIYNGTDEFNLDRGLGRIRGMAKMNEDGNLGISGHRDGFFRGLKDIQEGDRIMVRSTNAVEVYSVDDISIVDKNDASLLRELSEDKKLTLVTCYPFYFVGHAPQRYIVHASPISQGQ